MRRGLLEQFPAGVPLTVLAAGTAFYAGVAPQRPGMTLLPLASAVASMPPVADANAIVDGLDALVEPAAALRALRSATSGARLFALVANAACATTLATFLDGGELAASPLVAADLDRLFREGGWREVERIPLLDRDLARQTVPGPIAVAGVAFAAPTAEIAAGLRTAGYFVIADPR